MVEHWKWTTAGAFVLALTLASGAFSRSKPMEDFPDYNRLEYAKPRPEADKQVAEKQPGSIDMEVGHKRTSGENIPLDELPVSLRPNQAADTSEPPMDFIETMTPPAAPLAVSTTSTTTTTSTAPVQ